MKPFDNYEISPCRRYEEPDSPDKSYFEVCEPHETDVWTLYGHIPGEGVNAIGDFSKREYAEETFQRITGIPFAGACEVAARLRVMHAGPKLLEALERAEFLMRRVAEGDHEALGNLRDASEQARAAIAQAKGRAA
jgi:hypothetical protein